MDLELHGRVAVVSGASKGIGLAIASTLAAEGMTVVAASRTAPDLDIDHVPVDLMDPCAPAAVVAHAVERHGGVDVLVNNVGGPPPGDRLPHAGFLSRDDAHWRDILDFNLMTAVRFCRAALPILLERGGGAIVNVASSVARQPAPMNLDYGAAKAALLNLTKGLSEEFGAAGVRVNTVSPGPTLTPWWTDAGGAADIVARCGGAGGRRCGRGGRTQAGRRPWWPAGPARTPAASSPRSPPRRCSSRPAASSSRRRSPTPWRCSPPRARRARPGPSGSSTAGC